jgi:hypothetical protein
MEHLLEQAFALDKSLMLWTLQESDPWLATPCTGPYFHKAHSLVPYPTLIGVTRFDFGFPPRSPPTPFLQVNIEVPKHTKVSKIRHTSE